MNEFTLLYRGVFGRADTYVVEDAVSDFVHNGVIIPDSVAQAIASWWHSPGYVNSVRLSSTGSVGIETSISDFATKAEYDGLEYNRDRQELDALDAYIQVIQAQKRLEIDSLSIQEGDVLEDCPEDGKVVACHVISVDYSGQMGEGMKVYFESKEMDIIAAPQRVNVFRGL